MSSGNLGGCHCDNALMFNPREVQQAEDRLRPELTTRDYTQKHGRDPPREAINMQRRLLPRARYSKATAVARFAHCSHLPLVLLATILCFTFSHINRQPMNQAQAQFLFTYEINQESDESRVPRSSLFDPSSFRIVTPSQLQTNYQKLASQLPNQTPAQSVVPPPPPTPVVASAVPETAAAPESSQHFQPTSTLPSVTSPSSASSFLKQTSAALQSFAELFHLSPPSSSPAPLTAFQQSQSQGGLVNSQETPASLTSSENGIDQQAEARSLHEHWTQQQKRAHNQAGGVAPSSQLSAFQSFTTSPSVQLANQAQTSLAQNHQNHLGHTQQQQQLGGSQASYWLTSNPLSAPDGNFLVEIKNAGGEPSSTAQDVETNQNLARNQQQQQQDQTPNDHSSSHHQLRQQPPQVTTASSFTRSAPAHSSFLSTPTSAHFGLSHTPQTNARDTSGSQHAAPNVVTQHAPAAGSTHSDRMLIANQQQSFRKQQHFQPQSQPLHQHQARSLSSPQQRQPVATSTSGDHLHNHQHHHHQHHPSNPHQSNLQPGTDLLEGGHAVQLQPPANTPDHFNQAPARQQYQTAFRPPASSGPLKSAEESLIAFRQQQQSQHDQQSALFSAVQASQYAAAQAERQQANGEHSPQNTGALGNSLIDDEPTSPHTHIESGVGQADVRAKLSLTPTVSNTYSAAAREQVSPQPKQPAEIPKVSPQIYESFLLQQKDQYEKHMELLKQQQELNKLLEQKQKQQQQEREAAESKRKRKKDEIERLETRKKAAAAREQEQQAAAARKARQEAEEARRKQLRQIEEEEAKRRRLAEEERRYRELLEVREREEAQRKRQEAEQAAELARRQREQQERDTLAAEQKRRREQQEAAEEAVKQQQQYRNYLKQQEELKKLLELKQREDEAAQARQRQAGQISQQQRQQQAGRLANSGRASSSAHKLASEHRERARQATQSSPVGGQTPSWGGRQTRVRAVAVSSSNGDNVPETRQTFAPSSTTPSITTTTTTAASAPTTTNSSSSVPSRVGARLSTSAGGLRRLKADEKAIRQKIPLYSGAGKYGLYRSDSNSEELAKLLEAVTLPPSSSTTSTSTTTTTTSTTTTTEAPPPSSSSGDLLDADELTSRALTSSSLSPLLNLRELSVTPPSLPSAQDQARATTGEPFSSTTIFDDDVPRRPVRNSAAQARSRNSFPAPIQSAASVTSSLRTTLTNRMGSPSSGTSSGGGNSSSSTHHHHHRGASIGLASLPADSDNDGIPGRAGHEYPVLAEVPQTSFSCSRMKLSGFFADTETACQVVHLCQDGVQSSILCPNGTIFNQEKFSCQWWYEVNCARAPMFYQLNDNLYKSALTAATSDSSSSSSQDKETTPAAEHLNKRSRAGANNNLKSS